MTQQLANTEIKRGFKFKICLSLNNVTSENWKKNLRKPFLIISIIF